jgi:hypothetical protein
VARIRSGRSIDEQIGSAAAGALDAVIKDRPVRKPKLASRKKLAVEIAEMRKSYDWTAARAAHFVELYAWCHEQIYGVEAADINSPKERVRAVGAAKRMLELDFKGDQSQFARFIRWAWQRVQSKEKWAKENGAIIGRLSWQVLFSKRNVLTEYRLELARAPRKTS